MNNAHLTDRELQEFLDGTTLLSKAAERHVEQCPSCQASIEAYKSLYEQLRTADSPVIPDGFLNRVMGRVNSERVLVRKHDWFRSASVVGTAITLAGVTLGIVALRIFAPEVLLQIYSYVRTPFQIVDSALGSSTAYVLTEFNLKPEVILLTLITFGFIASVDRMVIWYRRSRKFLSLLA